MTRQYFHKELAEKIIHLCKNNKYKFIYISGNGGSGKSSFSKLLIELLEQHGISANYIDTDDFLINSQLRRNAKKERIDDNNKKRTSYYSSAFEESYNLGQLETIIYTLQEQIDCFYKSKRSENYIKLYHKYPITIVEGIGTAFLEKNLNVLSIWISCNEEVEIQRGKSLKRFVNRYNLVEPHKTLNGLTPYEYLYKFYYKDSLPQKV